MKKKSQYETSGKQYYEKMKAQGWKSYLCFGPPDLIAAIKVFMRDYKVSHDLYVRPEWAEKPRK